MSGLDRDEEKLFRQLFDAVREPGWALAPEAEAGVLVIDFDSMYGQMTWLRAQGGPRAIVALTAGTRAKATHILKRPVSEKALRDLLRKLVNQVPEVAQDDAAAADSSAPESAPGGPPHAQDAAADTAPPAPRRRVLIDYLQKDQLAGPARLRDAQPPLAINVEGGHYLGGKALKPLAAHCSRELGDDDWQPLSSAEFSALAPQLGDRQPLSRLLWLAGLSGFDGQLRPELAGPARFKLAKWPQTEREYPRQFRIATALLKQFGSVDEIAAASGVGVAEVADYINACHALGIIEVERAATTAPGGPEPTARGGLLGRLRRS